MITVISGSNRSGSECLTFATKYTEILKSLSDTPVKLLALENIPHDYFFPEMYQKGKQAESLKAIQDEYILPAQKFVYVVSEYNGSFTGAIKVFLDACSTRNRDLCFKGKKAALVGIASGRAGNLRGMDHLTGVLNHLGTIILPNKLPISSIFKLLDKQKNITDEDTIEIMRQQAVELLAF
jgi:NAD(P)H-dependent FMN reductase